MADAPETHLEILIRLRDGKVEALPPERLGELDTIVAEPGTIACADGCRRRRRRHVLLEAQLVLGPRF